MSTPDKTAEPSAEATPRLLDVLGQGDSLPSTDDVLAMTLPLLSQVLALHEEGRVAPLEGIDELHVTARRIWFERAKARAPKLEPTKLRALTRKESTALEVVSHQRRTTSEDGTALLDLDVVAPGDPITRPVALTRYVSWEHEIGHHDPLTDIYVLGLVLASVALDQNLGERAALERFTRAREHEATFGTRLHPVVARAIVRMTSLDRHARAQDLRALIATLRDYREQTLDFETPRTGPTEGVARRQAIYTRLRDRLFDFSRRNRLLHFASNNQSVNLTLGSVPLVLDYRNIDPDSLFTWQGRAAADVASGKPVPLGRYLRFEDYPFLTSALDQLRLDANRSKAELGFSPLRLAICFLSWHDLKNARDVRITSPLLLVPVALERKKGVRDAIVLTAESDRAEVNPVLRQYLRELYGIRLPESVDLAEPSAIATLQAELLTQIQTTEPAVSLTRIDKPRIDIVLAQAKRRLEAYRKRVSLSGRSARSNRGFDYSYARNKLAPLGVQLFSHLVYPAAAPQRELHEAPRPRVFHMAPPAAQTRATDEKEFYALHQGGTSGGPFEWVIDCANVTLASFHYRKMSLVRDYAGMIEGTGAHATFDALFSPDVRAPFESSAPLPTEQRFDVVPADPTQATAVAEARRGTSLIIQGPPGTGKSQTITNLIADQIAAGKRVLFVCEKRAAIDVVHHRLEQRGLGRLSCLIHDSQGDKKAFIKDLKTSYESWLASPASSSREDERGRAVAAVSRLLTRGERFRSVMAKAPADAELRTIRLLERSLELADVEGLVAPADALPSHRELMSGLEALRGIERALRAIDRDPRLGRHPLRHLGDAPLMDKDPAELAARDTRALLADLDALGASPLSQVAEVSTLGDLVRRGELVSRLKPLFGAALTKLLDASGEGPKRLTKLAKDLQKRREASSEASALAEGWRTPLPASEIDTALALARRYDGSFLAKLLGLFTPTFWRLRGLLRASYDFGAKALPPSWTEALERLQARYAAEAAVALVIREAQEELGVDDVAAATQVLTETKELRRALPALTTWLGEHGEDDPAALWASAERAGEVSRLAGRLLRDAGDLAPATIRERTEEMGRALGDLPAVVEPLRRLIEAGTPRLSALVRAVPATNEVIERAVCRRAVDVTLREHALDLLGGADWDALSVEARTAASTVRDTNAQTIVERAHRRFLANVALSNAPAGTLSREDKETKKAYAAGRKELEHEMGKTMRFKSIRDLAAGPAGAVIRDLKPVWLMSPLSVADTLPLEQSFDVVVFDEASQIPLEDALPAAFRGAQIIVVGDEMQLPPSTFFSSARVEGNDEEDVGEGYELDAQSLLTHAARTLPKTMLAWHYRSRDEALIAFSNRVFYEDKLLTVPAVSRLSPRPPITITGPEGGRLGAEALLDRTVSFHHVPDSPYENRRNRGEARYLAELVRALLDKKTGQTIGVVAFSEAQQNEIEQALRELADDDASFRALYEAEQDREEDGQHVGLFVKNLENVQGDERDIILISVCYGPDARGKMLMSFGPINKTGGEKRLNVIFSRAKHHLAVVSSIRYAQITNEYNDGAACLRGYLRYAEAMSVGSAAEAGLALAALGREARTPSPRGGQLSTGALEAALAAALRARGLEVDVGVGSSSFRCNLGVRRAGDSRYALGVFVDDPSESSAGATAEELLQARPAVLAAFGWRVITVLHRDWYEDPALVLTRLETALQAAAAE